MKVFGSISVRKRVTFITVLYSMLALAITAAAFIGNDLLLLRDALREELSFLAETMGNDIPVILAEREPKPARKVFPGVQPKHNGVQVKTEGFRFRPSIISVHLLDKDGRMLSQYQRDEKEPASLSDPDKLDGVTDRVLGVVATWLRPGEKNFQFHTSYVDLSKEILANGREIGTVLIRSDLGAFHSHLKRYGLVAGVALFVVFLFALLSSLTLCRFTATPIARLAKKLKGLSKESDYSIRFYSDARNEIGILGDAFNQVLEHVENLEKELKEHSAQLSMYREDHEKLLAAKSMKLSKSNETLKKAVLELRKAKEAAERASLAKSHFLAKMGQEIRMPLNGVLGMVTMLLDSELTEKQRKFAETVRFSAQAVLEIINDILSFSKIETGKLELEIVNFNLRKEIGETVELLVEGARSKGLACACYFGPDVPVIVRGDPVRLRKITANLLSNAIRFTDAGEVVVGVSTMGEVGDSVWLRFEVKDTGVGVPPEAHEDIFEAFSMADRSTTSKYGGTGLGLSICKQLTEMMGGQIGLVSKPAEGSTFWFTVRLTVPADPEFLKTLPPEMKGLRVLILDGNATNRSILEHQLASWGVESKGAENAKEALEELREAATRGESYHLALLDMSESDMEGITLAKAIKADSKTKDLRLVMVTPEGTHLSSEGMKQADIFTCLSKPVHPSHLHECIASLAELSAPAGMREIEKHHPGVPKEQFHGNILVAENNPVDRDVARSLLEGFGCKVDLVGSGLEAVETWSRNSYDLIFMDCQMPGMDGYEATKFIRQMEVLEDPGLRRGAPIVALTADGMADAYEHCLDAGMDDYVSKPFQQQDFQKILESWLLKKPTRDATVDPQHLPRRSSAPPDSHGVTAVADEP